MSKSHKNNTKNNNVNNGNIKKSENENVVITENELKDILSYEPEENKENKSENEQEQAENLSKNEVGEKSAKSVREEISAENHAEESSVKESIAEEKSAEQTENTAKDTKEANERGKLSEKEQMALDALDRDLENAKKNKEKELLEQQKAHEEEIRKEKEFLERAENTRRRAAELQENKQKASSEKAAAKAKTEEPKKSSSDFTPLKKEKDPLLGMKIIKGVTAFVVILGIAYAAGLIYTKDLNEEYIKDMESDLMGISIGSSDTDNETYDLPDNTMSREEKLENNLSLYLPDSDKDGLSDDYEMNVSKTDPLNDDSDGDKITDAAEIYAGLDPLTADDDTQIIDIDISASGAAVKIKGKPMNATATIDIVTNNSITGASGVIGNAYEFYTAYPMEECSITLSYNEDDLSSWNATPEGLSIYRFNSDTLEFEKLESTVDTSAKTVTAKIETIGIYVIGASEYVEQEYNTRIFFLIDNSGSMYSETLCPGSEENDMNFKRVDFANSVIDKLGDSADYGAAMFTGTYTKLSSVTSDREAVKTQIDSIRTSDMNFDGTRICDALSKAADELGNNKSDKNYIILLTDGYPTDSTEAEEAEALQKVVDSNITIFTVGLGKRIDSDYLNGISSATNGMYYQVSNASALERICDKIDSFMSYNKISVTLDTPTDVFITADSGFNVDKDSLSYTNFRTDFSETGTDFGIAELTRQYFTGELKLKESSYTTDDGTEISGYDINSSEQLSDGKPDLTDLKIGFLDKYNEYLAIENKWNYHSSSTGLLKYNSETMEFINNNRMTVSILPYTVKLPELEDWIVMLQKITLQKLPEFTTYECAVLQSSISEGADKDMMDAFRYMQYIHESSDKQKSYDFGYDGDTAFDLLVKELTNGNPVVISAGGSAYNAVRLLRESENTNKYILESYDCNNMGATTYIKLERTAVYDGGQNPYYQYSAEINGEEVPLILYN